MVHAFEMVNLGTEGSLLPIDIFISVYRGRGIIDKFRNDPKFPPEK